MPTNTSDSDEIIKLKNQVIEPQNIEEWGYGFYQHQFHRDISILSNKLPEDLIIRLKEHSLANRKKCKISETLAGQIAEEYETLFESDPNLRKELDIFLRQQVLNFLGQQPSDDFDWFAWTNISKPGEFNPVHSHQNCVLSWVLYLDIPEVIRQEYYQPITTVASKGLIKFYSNYSDHDLTFNPRTGDFFLFTATHRHSVGPFYTEGAERISLAGNIKAL